MHGLYNFFDDDWVSSRGPLAWEATALPTEPLSLSEINQFYFPVFQT